MGLTDPEWLFRIGPYSRVGSIVNLIVCGLMVVVGGGFLLFSGAVPGLFLVLWFGIGVFLLGTFTRIAIRAHRGDYDEDRGGGSGFFGPRR
jgi:hypothetical protein